MWPLVIWEIVAQAEIASCLGTLLLNSEEKHAGWLSPCFAWANGVKHAKGRTMTAEVPPNVDPGIEAATAGSHERPANTISGSEASKASSGDQAGKPGSDSDDTRLRWYQLKLGFWQAIWGTLITSGLAVAIPAAVEAYKLQVESYKIQQEISLKRVEMDHAYVNSFINQASTPDMDQRIRVTQYLAYISSDQSQIGWASLRRALEERRKELRNDIMEHEAGIIRLRGKAALTIDDQTQLAQHLQQLEWDEAEIGKIGSVLKR